ncbi:hypothetical protein [Streptomonospora nanhaiensis]|uniref:hypothetical protein n=1 Tax=Streptomonospora nanhaiensis TaxID=1323731 RepID=UPI001C390D1F|nr:hypothetical protein [Streptomonospora nanhaiensis]MBV2365037.1 hypothetical protein [Streptomonospora nanhaiensis]
MLETLSGVLVQVGNALSSGDGLRLLIYGNTAVLLAINSIAGRITARKKAEALRNRALAAGGPLAKQRTAIERWMELQRQRAELTKGRVETRAQRARAAEYMARQMQNTERGAGGLLPAARNIAEIFRKANEKRDEEAEKTPEIILPQVTRRTRPHAGRDEAAKTSVRR